MPFNGQNLPSLGWGPSFQKQLSEEDFAHTFPCRVMEAHRGQLILSMGEDEIILHLKGKISEELVGNQIAVGDWLLVSKEDGTLVRMLERTSLIKRQAAGTDGAHQMVVANIDILFIVTSCNEDFNLSRLERYLVIAYAAGVLPVIVLTKPDIIEDAANFAEQAQALAKDIDVVMVNARDPSAMVALRKWCEPGKTIALVGSSGVGKSTLANALGATPQKTGRIREEDAKGRHTTTHRSLLPIANGPVLLDSPGMRGMGIVDAGLGLEILFEEVVSLSQQCRFSNCLHDQEPDCAIKTAISNNELTLRRVSNYNKLLAEDKYNSAPEVERRTKEKTAGLPHRNSKFSRNSKKSR